MIPDLLERLGFSRKEILVYLTLVQKGKLTANALALSTKLNRTTAYGILSVLKKKGLIIEDLGAPAALYLPAPTANLVEQFEKQESQLRKQKELATRAAGEIDRLAGKHPFQFAKISFVQESEIESHLIRHTPIWCKSLLAYDGVWRGFQDSRLLKHFPEYFEILYSKELPHNATQELVSEDMPAELDYEKHHHFPRRGIKIWQHGYNFTYSTWIIGDFVIMIQAKDHPFYLIEMKDVALAKNLRDLFSGIWKFLK